MWFLKCCWRLRGVFIVDLGFFGRLHHDSPRSSRWTNSDHGTPTQILMMAARFRRHGGTDGHECWTKDVLRFAFDKKFGSLTQIPAPFLYLPPGFYIDRCIIPGSLVYGSFDQQHKPEAWVLWSTEFSVDLLPPKQNAKLAAKLHGESFLSEKQNNYFNVFHCYRANSVFM